MSRIWTAKTRRPCGSSIPSRWLAADPAGLRQSRALTNRLIDALGANEGLRGGKRIPFKVELADTPEAQARGLMFRDALGDFEGMIFPSDTPAPRSFWMKNTPLSLDIIFIGADGRIINIAANTEPYSLASVTSKGPAGAVLELRAGRAAALGIVPGDRVIYKLPE